MVVWLPSMLCDGDDGRIATRAENNAIKLWIPQESDFSTNYAWLWNNFPPEIRQVVQ